jgi:integrase
MSKCYVNPSDHFGKPAKPSPDYPLFPHNNGCWCKKIRGRLHYFGTWTNRDPDHGADAALREYLRQKDDLHAGRHPRTTPEATTVKDVVNGFLNAKQQAVDDGELSPRTWLAYKAACDAVVETFGRNRLASDLGPADFAKLRNQLAKRSGVHWLKTQVQYARSCFKHAFDSRLLDRPIHFGPGFKAPSKKTMRLHRAKQGPKLFASEEVHRLIDAAGPQMRAMILLGVNAGFGNADCGTLPLSALDLDRGILDYPRPKTGIPRRAILWPETVKAIRAVLAARKTPEDPALVDLVFLTKRGLSWAKEVNDCPIAKETAKLLKRLGINDRKRLGFYALRHTFRTVADEAKDQPAADYIMGHEVPHMSSVYRETISDTRLKAVTDHVRAWFLSGRSATGLPPGWSDKV